MARSRSFALEAERFITRTPKKAWEPGNSSIASVQHRGGRSEFRFWNERQRVAVLSNTMCCSVSYVRVLIAGDPEIHGQ
jgi:hypothetical protein